MTDAHLMDWSLAGRLGLAALLSALLGLEREFRGQVAGFRTHILVAIGACLYTMTGAYGFGGAELLSNGESGRADVTRVASQVVVGIGFLGGGAIVHYGATVRGLTTAANLWVAAALGLACGAGFFSGAILTALIAFIVLSGLKPLERRIRLWRGKARLTPSVEADIIPSDGRRKHREPPAPASPH